MTPVDLKRPSMSGKQVVTKCEGSLQYDEESSESEEEGSVGGRSSEQAPLVFEQDSDDEEELEVFGGVKKGQPREVSCLSTYCYH